MRKIIWIVLGGVALAGACHRGIYDHPVGIERQHDVVPTDLSTPGSIDAGAPVEAEGRVPDPQPGISRPVNPPMPVRDRQSDPTVSPTVGTHMEAPPAPKETKPKKKGKKDKPREERPQELEGIQSEATDGTLPTFHPDRVGTIQQAQPLDRKAPTKQQNTYGDAPNP